MLISHQALVGFSSATMHWSDAHQPPCTSRMLISHHALVQMLISHQALAGCSSATMHWSDAYQPVGRIQNNLMQIRIRIPLFKLIQILLIG